MENESIEWFAVNASEWKLPNGDLHRTDGPAVKYPDGSEAWYINGKLHRTDGPASTWENAGDFNEQWYINGKLHRLDGPASLWSSGDESNEQWCINGHNVTSEIHKWARGFGINLDNLSNEDKQMIALYWANYDGGP